MRLWDIGNYIFLDCSRRKSRRYLQWFAKKKLKGPVFAIYLWMNELGIRGLGINKLGSRYFVCFVVFFYYPAICLRFCKFYPDTWNGHCVDCSIMKQNKVDKIPYPPQILSGSLVYFDYPICSQWDTSSGQEKPIKIL